MDLNYPSPTVPAFILGLSVTGLAALRALRRAKIAVLGFDPKRTPPGRFSYRAKTVRCPIPETEPGPLLEHLLRFAPGDRRPVLIPISDAFLLFLSRFRSDLEKAFAFSLPNEDLVEAIVDKRRQYALAERYGVPCPHTLVAENHQALLRSADQIAFPAFLKPAYSHLWAPVFRNKGLLVQDPAVLKQVLETVAARGLDVVIQRIIPGPATNHYEVCVHMDRQSQPIAVFTTRKLRQWPIDFGGGTLIESTHHRELEQLSVDFLKAIAFKGTAAIEFKRDAETGQFFMLEVNARLWSDHALATRCGLNFPLLIYRDLVGPRPQLLTDYPMGVRWLDGARDLWASLTLARRGLIRPTDWLTSLSAIRSFAFFDASDPLPFLWEMVKLPHRFSTYLMRSLLRGRDLSS